MAYTRVMKRTLASGASALLVLGIGAGSLLGRGVPAPRVYTVDEIQAAVQRQPRVWLGRTVLVRGWSDTASGLVCMARTSRAGPRLPVISPASCARAWIMLTPAFPYTGPPALAFSVLLARGSAVPTRVDEQTALAMGLHTVPGVGASLFRWSGSQTLRVRVTMNAALCATPPPCGVQVP